jgi:hypothetical protein
MSLRRLALALTTGAVLAATQAAWPARAGFLPGTEDVPLMPGLRASAKDVVLFDKPQGRIVETSASGKVSREAVLSFYRESLPQLGWSRADERHFLRDGERLSLDFDGKDGNLTVAFTLEPH